MLMYGTVKGGDWLKRRACVRISLEKRAKNGRARTCYKLRLIKNKIKQKREEKK